MSVVVLEADKRVKPLMVNRFPRVLADEYGNELAREVERMHDAVMAIVRARLRAAWRIRYGEAVVEASLSDILDEISDKVYEFFEGGWAGRLVRRFTHAAVAVAGRNLLTELRRALRSRAEDVLLPGVSTRLYDIQEERIIQQIMEIKSIPERYVLAVSRLVTEAAVTGLPYGDLEDELEELLGMTQDRAHMIAVTEMGRIYKDAALDRYDAVGVDHVIWIVADDERTCEVCRDLDGERMTIERARDMLPKHPNCRCAVIADPDELREAF